MLERGGKDQEQGVHSIASISGSTSSGHGFLGGEKTHGLALGQKNLTDANYVHFPEERKLIAQIRTRVVMYVQKHPEPCKETCIDRSIDRGITELYL